MNKLILVRRAGFDNSNFQRRKLCGRVAAVVIVFAVCFFLWFRVNDDAGVFVG